MGQHGSDHAPVHPWTHTSRTRTQGQGGHGEHASGGFTPTHVDAEVYRGARGEASDVDAAEARTPMRLGVTGVAQALDAPWSAHTHAFMSQLASVLGPDVECAPYMSLDADEAAAAPAGMQPLELENLGSHAPDSGQGYDSWLIKPGLEPPGLGVEGGLLHFTGDDATSLREPEYEPDHPGSGRAGDAEADTFGKAASRKRWLMLLLGVLIILGPYYAFDNPAGTQMALRRYLLGEDAPAFAPGAGPVGGLLVASAVTGASPAHVGHDGGRIHQVFDSMGSSAVTNATESAFDEDYQLLYTVYSLPNTVLPLFGGVLVDRLGVRTMCIACVVLSLVGQVLVAVGVSFKSWALMLAGRGIFGVGTESLCVAQRILVAQWFRGKEMALAMGAILAFGRLGSVINDNVSAVFSAEHVADAYYVGAGMCALSVVAAVLASWLDRAHERAHTIKDSTNARNSMGATAHSARRSCKWAVLHTLALTKRLPFAFWALCIVALAGFPPVTTFNGVAPSLLEHRFAQEGQNVGREIVNATLGILYTVAAVSAPVIGAFIDRLHRRGAFAAVAQLALGGCHALMTFTNIPAGVIIGLLGLAFATFAAAFWPAVATVAPAGMPGVAFGVAGAVQNIGLAVAPIVVARLQPPRCNSSYDCVELLFIGMCGIAAIFSVIVARWEPRAPPISFSCRRCARSRDADEPKHPESEALLSISVKEDYAIQ